MDASGGKDLEVGAVGGAAGAVSPGERRVWVVVVAKPQQERLARFHLEQQGFEPYLPMKLSLNVKKQQLVAMPFLPGYLFGRTGLGVAAWGKIWNTRGVHAVLGSGDRPIAVRDAVIERIRLQEEAGYIRVGLEADASRFTPGQKVRVMGDLGIEGLFLESVDRKRATLLVSLLGRDSRLTVDIRKLRAAGG